MYSGMVLDGITLNEDNSFLGEKKEKPEKITIQMKVDGKKLSNIYSTNIFKNKIGNDHNNYITNVEVRGSFSTEVDYKNMIPEGMEERESFISEKNFESSQRQSFMSYQSYVSNNDSTIQYHKETNKVIDNSIGTYDSNQKY